MAHGRAQRVAVGAAAGVAVVLGVAGAAGAAPWPGTLAAGSAGGSAIVAAASSSLSSTVATPPPAPTSSRESLGAPATKAGPTTTVPLQTGSRYLPDAASPVPPVAAAVAAVAGTGGRVAVLPNTGRSEELGGVLGLGLLLLGAGLVAAGRRTPAGSTPAP